MTTGSTAEAHAARRRSTTHERFGGSLGAVKRLCLRLRKAKGVAAEDVSIPVQTAGEAAQVDFGYMGQLYDPEAGHMRKA